MLALFPGAGFAAYSSAPGGSGLARPCLTVGGSYPQELELAVAYALGGSSPSPELQQQAIR
jgi:hypothetical protein